MRRLKTHVFFLVAGFFYSLAYQPALAAPVQRQTLTPFVHFSAPVVLTDGESHVTRRGLYNGYKGYRHHRPGYRRYNDGWWYPQAAFDGTPAPIQAEQPEKASAKKTAMQNSLPQKHIRWCSDKYRSYRLSDNTFQPMKGARKTCRSPFFEE